MLNEVIEMDKEEAIRILAGQLVRLGYINIEKDSMLQYYLGQAHHSVLIPNRDDKPKRYYEIEGKGIKFDEQEIKLAKQLGANYLFTDFIAGAGGYVGGGYGTIQPDSIERITAFALITGHEERILRERYYRDVPNQILDAMDTLDLKHFVRDYEMYLNGQICIDNLREYYAKYPGLRGKGLEVGDLVYGRDKNKHDLFGRVTTFCLAKEEDIWMTYIDKYTDCSFKEIELTSQNYYSRRFIKLSHWTDFFDFIFKLPLEERNIETDKRILTEFSHLFDCKEALLGDYRRIPEIFTQYLGVLEEEQQKSVVEFIKGLDKEKQNPDINMQLFEFGFDGLYLQFLDLYQNNPAGFMKYLDGSDDAHRLEIIERLYTHTLDEKNRNKETDTLLEKKYRDLIEEVGIRMIPKPGEKE